MLAPADLATVNAPHRVQVDAMPAERAREVCDFHVCNDPSVPYPLPGESYRIWTG